MIGLGEALDYVAYSSLTSPVVIFSGWKVRTNDVLGSFHYLLQGLSGSGEKDDLSLVSPGSKGTDLPF